MQLCNHRVMDALGRFAKHNSLWLWRCLPHRLAKLQDYAHQDDHASPTYQMTTGFKPFTVFLKQALYHRNRHGLRTRQKGKRNMNDFGWYLITPTIPQSLAMLKQTALSNLHLAKKKIEELRTTTALLQSVYTRRMIYNFSTHKMSKTFNNVIFHLKWRVTLFLSLTTRILLQRQRATNQSYYLCN